MWSSRREKSHGPNAASAPVSPCPSPAARRRQATALVRHSLRGRRAEGEPSDSPALGRSDHLPRDTAADRQDVTVEVVELQRGQLAAPGTGIRGQPSQQQHLLPPMHLRIEPSRLAKSVADVVDLRSSKVQDVLNDLDRSVQPGCARRRPAHLPQRRRVQDALAICPAERRPQTAHPRRNRGRTHPRFGPTLRSQTKNRRGHPRRPTPTDRVRAQRPHERAVPSHCRGPPAMWSRHPSLEQIGDTDTRRRPPTPTDRLGFCRPPCERGLGVVPVTVHGHRPDQAATRHFVRTERDPQLPCPGSALP